MTKKSCLEIYFPQIFPTIFLSKTLALRSYDQDLIIRYRDPYRH